MCQGFKQGPRSHRKHSARQEFTAHRTGQALLVSAECLCVRFSGFSLLHRSVLKMTMVYSVLQSKVSHAHPWEITGEPSDLRRALRTLPAHLPGGWGQGNVLELPSPQNPTHWRTSWS